MQRAKLNTRIHSITKFLGNSFTRVEELRLPTRYTLAFS